MLCEGYHRDPHEVTAIHGHDLCDACYQKKYREEHQTEIIKYQQEYRADPAYSTLNRLYVRVYRARH